MKSFFTVLFSVVSIASFSQWDNKKLESSFDLGFGNHFGLRQISEGYQVNGLSASNFTFGWNNYFTNNKFGGRLELSFDKMDNNSSSNEFQTNYFRSTYYLNASLKNLVGWGSSARNTVDETSFWNSFDVDLGMGVGYSAMTSELYKVDETVFLKKADDMLNISFRVAPSIQLSDKVKLFASYTRINHSAQSVSFDFTENIRNTAFKGAFRTVNVGIRFTPNTDRIYDRTLKEAHKKWHFFTSFDASIGNHFAGTTEEETQKFNSGGISHLNIGANHKYPNSKLFGRFDVGFDAFKAAKGDPSFDTKYFRTTYQAIADLRTLRGVYNENNRMDLALGFGIGFSTMYNAESSNRIGDIFLNGDDMYALVFSVNPSYRISKRISLIANATFTSHSLQTIGWNMVDDQANSAFNGSLMNASVGLRYHMIDRRTNYTSEIVHRIPRILSFDAAIGSHFAGTPIANSFALSGTPGRHIALGLNHPFINPIYFGRFEFAFDALSPNSSSIDFKSSYYRANYFLMSSVQRQLRQSISSERPARKFDVQFGLGLGASKFRGNGVRDYFITRGDDMLNLAAKIVPTYSVSDNISVFAAYTFISHSLQSVTYDFSENIDKKMFNGHLMNASVGVSIAMKSSKRRAVIEVTPVDTTSKVIVVPTQDSTMTPTQDPVVTTPDPAVTPTQDSVVSPTPDPVVTPAPDPTSVQPKPTRKLANTVSDYPVNGAEVPESQKQYLRDVAFQMKENKYLTVVLSGHTDVIGTPEYNIILSRKRAANVKAYLVLQGVPASRIKVEYYGRTRPVASNLSVEGRMLNRRVEVKIVKK